MPNVVIPKRPAWSYSRLEAFANCPKRFLEIQVLKNVKEGETQEQKYGKDLHKAMELRIGENKPIPKRFEFMEPIAAKFAALPGEKLCEWQIAVDENFKLVDWFAHNVWARCIIDLAVLNDHRALIVDWKTGKKISDDFTQQRAAAALLMAVRPEIQEVEMIYYWTAHRKPTHASLAREDMKHVWGALVRKIRPYMEAHATKTFNPRPSGLCKSHCPVTTCPHHGGR